MHQTGLWAQGPKFAAGSTVNIMLKNDALPQSLIPADGRFGAGPSRIRPEQLEAIAHASEWGTSHRQPPIIDLVNQIRTGLTELFSLPDGYEIVLGNGGTTAFWAVATVSLIRENAAVAQFGEFGSKFAADIATSPWLAETVYAAPAGEVAFVDTAPADAGCYPQNETSTGATSPIYRTSQELTLVDATSIAGASVVDFESVDAYYFAPQKCFGSDGGLWLAAMSPAAIARAEELEQRTDRPQPGFLNLAAAIRASRKGQTVNTPAIGTLLLLREQIEWMLANGGLSAMAAKAAAGAKLIQNWAEDREWASLFVKNPEWRSPVVTTVDLDDQIPVPELSQILRKAGVVDIEGYRGLGRNQLRISSFPSIATEDIEAALACIDWVIDA